jgi:hypothetical protein
LQGHLDPFVPTALFARDLELCHDFADHLVFGAPDPA